MYDKYRDSTNIDARIELHDRFSDNPYGWHRWVFDNIQFPLGGSFLELGCGPGYLWTDNLDRLPEIIDLTLSDQSIGMVLEVRSRLSEIPLQAKFSVVDAGYISYPEDSFNAVIANHMFYYVKDPDRTLSEICRVLSPGGCFYATTNGPYHLIELADLFIKFDNVLFGHLIDDARDYKHNRFNLSNVRDYLSSYFSDVEITRYEDAIEVEKLDPLIPWAEFWVNGQLPQSRTEELREFLSMDRSELQKILALLQHREVNGV
jgi:ubiquinone/menaquinone biosynthesis C-methylase UbiE